MADPYWRRGAPSDRGSIPRSSFPGYLPLDPSVSAAHHLWGTNDLHGAPSDYPPKDILPVRPGAHDFDDIMGIRVPPKPVIGGFTATTNIKGYPNPVEDPNLIGQRRDVAHGISPGIPDIERPSSFGNVESLPPPVQESNILFVDGLPKDCTRREVGQIRVVHKEPRHSGDKAMVLCFVEFNDASCSRTALEALQGYKFDDKKPDSPTLRIQFAHFPFRLPSDLGVPLSL
ncbi:RNA-binding protein 1 isoform X2 [Vitis vinifera]|uniref:RNA-binding protein 1 isoform X2 n=1 Tax=Vitis vinifera TaxID=29760 RepID=UPI000198312B|nr:RNA-binding protein 1 isoform X2 [Vitis vinifera]|eukprot:XP_002280083.1 PREDICTED: RNA-binding protein 1 isoform X2 [Vitis vinifera]